MHVSITGVKTVKTLLTAAPPNGHELHLSGVGLPMPALKDGVPDTTKSLIAESGSYLGTVPIREDNTCLFGVLDLDDDGVDLHELEAKVVAFKLPLVVCRSKSGGAHLYCFLRAPVDARVLVDALKKFRAVLGHERNANGSPVEIFPKQVKLAPGQTGNWINLPYYDHEHTNRYAVTGQRVLGLSEFLAFADTRTTSEAGLLEWADPALGPFKDGPICLQELHKQGCPDGGRNNTLLNVGIFYKVSQPGSWQEALKEYNGSIEAPVDERELAQIIRNLERHEYAYTCSNHPLENVCKKKPCKKQLYGISVFSKKKRLDSLPELSNLVKTKSDPPMYRVSVNGIVLECTLDQIYSPILFCRLVFERMNIRLVPPKEHEWAELMQQLTDSMTEEDASPDASKFGRLIGHLDVFLQTRFKSDSLDDVLLSKAAVDATDKRVYFRGLDLLVFLDRRGFREYQPHEIYSKLTNHYGLKTSEKALKGATVALWSVPEPTNDQSEPFDHPADKHVKPY